MAFADAAGQDDVGRARVGWLSTIRQLLLRDCFVTLAMLKVRGNASQARGLGDASYSLRTLQLEPRTGLSILILHLASVCGKHSRVLLQQTSPALLILSVFHV